MKKELKRNCPNCENIITYSCHSNFNTANKKNSFCRECYINTYKNPNRIGNISPLLEDNPISYYWMGFLLADAHFYEKGCLKLTLAIKDLDHIKKLSKLLNCNVSLNEKNCTIKIMQKKETLFLMDKFSISNVKTYDPPDLSFIQNDILLKSLIIGFIDGDGCISRKGNFYSITVKCHGSWIENLNFLAKKINPTTNAKLTKDGYAYFTISNIKSIIDLKNFIINNNLPVLNRKWNDIDVNYIIRDKKEEQYLRIESEVLKILGENKTYLKRLLETIKKHI